MKVFYRYYKALKMFSVYIIASPKTVRLRSFYTFVSKPYYPNFAKVPKTFSKLVYAYLKISC